MISFLVGLIPQPLGNIRGIGPLGLENKNPCEAPALFENVLSTTVGVLTASAIIWFIFQFIIGAFDWISAGGDSKAIEAARKRLTNAAIGLAIALGALVIVSVIGFLLGIDILNIQYFIFKVSGTNPAC